MVNRDTATDAALRGQIAAAWSANLSGTESGVDGA
jgi:hypothetical protein